MSTYLFAHLCQIKKMLNAAGKCIKVIFYSFVDISVENKKECRVHLFKKMKDNGNFYFLKYLVSIYIE